MADPLKEKFSRRLDAWRNNLKIWALGAGVKRQSPKPSAGDLPVVFFHASTRTGNLSLNAAFSQLVEWSLRAQGVPTVRFACDGGMTRCVLGSNRDDPTQPPPCRQCLRRSWQMYRHSEVRWFEWEADMALQRHVEALAHLEALQAFSWPLPGYRQPLPLGKLVLPSLRWMLRRHNLEENEQTLFFYRQYILSAWNVARQFDQLLDDVRPQAVVLFNGQFYPEATARWLALQRNIRTVTHEVGMRPFSAFFTTGEATAYPLNIPSDFQLSEEQNARLDAYLSRRFQGDFTMAGVRFWPEMRRLDERFVQKLTGFRQVVPIFTNVIFDTSQPHANVIFRDMFHWLDTVLEIIRAHPETLFVIRAHPDEARPGKASRESVAMWVRARGVEALRNVIFVPPEEYISSYELIQRAKFVMVYNSTIGLEASILGAAVLSGGRSRFTPYETVFFPRSEADFRQLAEDFLSSPRIAVPAAHRLNARRFFYWQLYRSSLPFSAFLRPGSGRYTVHFRSFALEALLPENSRTMAAISDGILRGGDFMLKE